MIAEASRVLAPRKAETGEEVTLKMQELRLGGRLTVGVGSGHDRTI